MREPHHAIANPAGFGETGEVSCRYLPANQQNDVARCNLTADLACFPREHRGSSSIDILISAVSYGSDDTREHFQGRALYVPVLIRVVVRLPWQHPCSLNPLPTVLASCFRSQAGMGSVSPASSPFNRLDLGCSRGETRIYNACCPCRHPSQLDTPLMIQLTPLPPGLSTKSIVSQFGVDPLVFTASYGPCAAAQPACRCKTRFSLHNTQHGPPLLGCETRTATTTVIR